MSNGLMDVLEALIANISSQQGFSYSEPPCLPILTNLLLAFLESIGAKSLSYAESAGRSKLILNDIFLALVDYGYDISSLINQNRPAQHRLFKEPPQLGETSHRGITCKSIIGPGASVIIPRAISLRSDLSSASSAYGGSASVLVSGPASRSGTGQSTVPAPPPKQPPRAPPNLFLPPIPDPHTYISTRVTRPPPANNLASLRRRVLDQRRRVQMSLTTFLSRTQPVYHLFSGDPESFPLLLPPLSSRPYLSALLADSTAESSALDDADALTCEHMMAVPGTQSTFAQSATAYLDESKISTDEKSSKVNFYLEKPQFPVV